jgi:hypothetical protein
MKSKILLAGSVALFVAFSANAQGLVGKLKQKASQAAEKALDKKVDQKTGNTPNTNQQGQQNSGNNDNNGTYNNSNGGNPSNSTGAGLVSTPPDVKANLSDAEAAYKTASYGEARYAVQQAMLGVELEIGQKVLKSLPETVNGLKKNESRDQVTSTGYGWAGLTIAREYANNDDKQLRTTIANNAAWMSAINMYMANGGYAQQTGGQQNWKQIRVKGYKAIIEFNEGSGYKLSIPIGQSSLLVLEAVNYATEKEMTDSANQFDIDGIKNMLGEK